tara:strand:- start:261 stop:929 length:669 start_codon:yes stop_codon:yes gene_type:complete
MSNFTWSYSSLSLFKQCPRRFFRERILKDISEPERDYLIYGKEAHQAAEEYGRDGVDIPEKYKFIQPYVDKLMKTAGEKYYEYKMALTCDLEPCSFEDTDSAWWRGIADFVAVDGDKALLVDYKTGKSTRYADTKQLEVLSLALFRHFPEVTTVKGGLLFVVAEELVEESFYREREDQYWANWDGDLDRLNICFESDTWNPETNFSCYKFCPVLDCEYNGRS